MQTVRILKGSNDFTLPFSEQSFAILVRRIAALDLGSIGTPERLAAMCAILSQPGPISVSALAHEQEVRAATMSRMLTSLYNDGMIKRVDDAHDGRGRLVTTTAKGFRATERARKVWREHIGRIMDTMEL